MSSQASVVARRVFYLSPHPDDVALSCAGSLLADVAAGAGLHETVTDDGGTPMPNMPEMDMGDGTTSMQDLATVPLAAQARVRFEPGGKHVMLTGLATELVAGDTVPITLTFRSGATVSVDALVADNPPAG